MSRRGEVNEVEVGKAMKNKVIERRESIGIAEVDEKRGSEGDKLRETCEVMEGEKGESKRGVREGY